jgi:trehalose synthase
VAAPARMTNDGTVDLLRTVPVPHRPVSRLRPVIGAQRYERLLGAAESFRRRLAGRRIWNVNSTAVGGGVAEMLQALVGYVEDLRVPIRWSVIGGDAEFFVLTKRLHNHIHGAGDGRPFTAAEDAHYRGVLDANAAELVAQVDPGDIVLLHDPQTAGLAAALARAGARVVWRCHIGLDERTPVTRAAWDFLRPHLADAHGYVFSRATYVPPWVPPDAVRVIPPSIDPFSAKNQELDAEALRAILVATGVLDAPRLDGPGRFVRRDGAIGIVSRQATIVGERLPLPSDPVAVQVSRWDRLKDMAGVMAGFAAHTLPGPGYLMLVGPAVAGVTDDPEGLRVYGECVEQWRALPPAARQRILLVTLPLEDVDENAAMVNAIQRHARVIVQKSLAEGFGLTVAEGMWKARTVVGSAVGGIVDQIVDGTGVLLADPTDLATFGARVRELFDEPERADRLGLAGQRFVQDNFVGDLHLLRYAELFGRLLEAPPGRPTRG